MEIGSIKVYYVGSGNVTLAEACNDGEKYYGTYSNSHAFVVPSGLTVSEINVVKGKLEVNNYEVGAVVPENTGVMVSSTTYGNKAITFTGKAGSALGTNLLKASGDAGINAASMAAAAPGCVYYRLTMHNGTEIGFYYGAADGAAFALAANKAYLAVPPGSLPNAKEGFSFISGEEETDGIRSVQGSGFTVNGEAYNLAGQKVGADYKGIVIVNGKKYLNK